MLGLPTAGKEHAAKGYNNDGYSAAKGGEGARGDAATSAARRARPLPRGPERLAGQDGHRRHLAVPALRELHEYPAVALAARGRPKP